MDSGTFSESADIVLDNASVSVDFLHGFNIKFKVRGVTVSIWMCISFLAQHDFVDESGSTSGCRREPYSVDTGEVSLKAFK